MGKSKTTKGVEFYAVEVENIHTEKIQWKGVKQINNIEYIQGEPNQSIEASTKVRLWQSWKVGPGKVHRWNDFEKTVTKVCPLKIISSTNVAIPWVDDSTEKADKNNSNDNSGNSSSATEEDEDENEYDDQSKPNDTSDNEMFECLVDGCVASYRYHAHLLRHYTIGKHQMKLEKYSLIDKSKMLFHQNLTTNYSHSTPLLSITVVPAANNSIIPPLTENWAAQKNKPTVRFNHKQKQFLEEKFNQGVETGMKWDPATVALDMETLTNNGNYVFSNDECLTQSQIKSYFSRLVVKQRTTQRTFDQQTTPSNQSSSTTINTVDTQLSTTDESTDDEEVDERDLKMYSWRQLLDEARVVMGPSLNDATTTSSGATANSLSNATPPTKRKSSVDRLKNNKYKSK
ncbi:unnamed protein product [Adineta steineri]|uniref:C2H2-type domain-containing protein n=2 Tax=Adineta steineri TaxID=433720 RepID=A0A820C589_9BILA|nr:unnamed protein product [Adineta steineri]